MKCNRSVILSYSFTSSFISIFAVKTFIPVNVIYLTGAKKQKILAAKTAAPKQNKRGKEKTAKKEGSTFRGKVLNSFVWVYGTEKTYRKLVYCTTISVCHYENMNSIRQISNCRITYGGGLGMTPCIMGLTTQDPYILFKFIKCSARKIITRCLAQFS